MPCFFFTFSDIFDLDNLPVAVSLSKWLLPGARFGSSRGFRPGSAQMGTSSLSQTLERGTTVQIDGWMDGWIDR